MVLELNKLTRMWMWTRQHTAMETLTAYICLLSHSQLYLFAHVIQNSANTTIFKQWKCREWDYLQNVCIVSITFVPFFLSLSMHVQFFLQCNDFDVTLARFTGVTVLYLQIMMMMSGMKQNDTNQRTYGWEVELNKQSKAGRYKSIQEKEDSVI